MGVIRWKGLALSLIAVVALIAGFGSATRVSSQNATPEVSPIVSPEPSAAVVILNAEGTNVGTANFAPRGDGSVTVLVNVYGLPAGDHGIHIHETGNCDASGDTPFSSAGGHFNPTGVSHGGPSMDGAHMDGTPEVMPAGSPEADTGHAGDLGNITVGEDGKGTLTVTTDRFTVEEGGSNSLQDADGSAIVIHADADDLMTDPSGNSGARIACGVIFHAMDATPVAGS